MDIPKTTRVSIKDVGEFWKHEGKYYKETKDGFEEVDLEKIMQGEQDDPFDELSEDIKCPKCNKEMGSRIGLFSHIRAKHKALHKKLQEDDE